MQQVIAAEIQNGDIFRLKVTVERKGDQNKNCNGVNKDYSSYNSIRHLAELKSVGNT